ncbi:hypothetical protein ACKI1K_45940, partial [Streptomyces scabiei]
GEIERRAMVGQVLYETRRTIRNISSVAGLRAATDLPGALLREHGIEVRHDLPGVGENLQDHLQVRCAYKVHGVTTMNEQAN